MTSHMPSRNAPTHTPPPPRQMLGDKSMLEIEMNENLRRRQEELKAILDNIRSPDDSVSVEDTAADKKRLQQINRTIDELQGDIDCELARSVYRVPA